MAQAQHRTLSKRVVDGLSVNGKDAVFWDRDLAGFGVRVYPSGKKVFVVQTRAFGRSKRVTLGTHGDITTEIARRDATEVIARIKKGQPAVRAEPEPTPDPTVADLAERYQREYVEKHCKPATISHYRLMLRKHIVPALGERLVADVDHKDILAFHNKLHRMPTVANRAADILVKTFNLADAWGWRPSGANPCRGVSRFKVEKHERFLTREELYRLGQALRAAPAERLASTHAAAAIRLLVLTGCRRNEILGLRWDDLNFDTGEMRLLKLKTGARAVPLSPAAKLVLTTLPRVPTATTLFQPSWRRTPSRGALGRASRGRRCVLGSQPGATRPNAPRRAANGGVRAANFPPPDCCASEATVLREPTAHALHQPGFTKGIKHHQKKKPRVVGENGRKSLVSV